MLRRAEFYLGNAVYRRGLDVRPGEHEPIITPEQAHAAKRAAARRQRTGRYGSRSRVYVVGRVAWCACGLRLRGETLVRAGPPRVSLLPLPRPPRRSLLVIQHPSRCRRSASSWSTWRAIATPDGVVDRMRDELRTMRHVPDEGLRAQRQRIETAMKRLGDRYTWQEIDETEYRAERRALEERLAELPLPADSNVACVRPCGRVAAALRGRHHRHDAGASASHRPAYRRARDHHGRRRHRGHRQARGAPVLRRLPSVSCMAMAPPDGLEPPTRTLGRCRSIH